MLELIKQLFKFMQSYRKFWLAPLLIGVVLLGALLVAAQSTAITPFIYAIF